MTSETGIVKQLNGVRINFIAAAVPANKVTLEDLVQQCPNERRDEFVRNAKASGLRDRYVANAQETASDLCIAAASKAMASRGIDPTSIDALIFVSQTPDLRMPATAHLIQQRLGLGTRAFVLDVNLGCSGYTHGLWLASTLMLSGQMERVLLCAGDTLSKLIAPADIDNRSLFGDAGTATLLERDEQAVMAFTCGVDGGGAQHLTVGGGLRLPGPPDHFQMNGFEVAAFSRRVVPPMVAKLFAGARVTSDEIDYCLFHQANEMMLRSLIKRCGFATEQAPVVLGYYGNTSSASIPLAAVHIHTGLNERPNWNLMMAGFGTGLSWSGIVLRQRAGTVDPLIVLAA